ncbi:hypothetical protein [Pannonibacter indicus]|jgi:hypothetical protein|uniref:hypothetical protein n=1 Tax=Pannonibacter indicus TaxID=466044 RepID=UPI0012E0EC81|nr:hypothetical protein [Pannonibacter indicus]
MLGFVSFFSYFSIGYGHVGMDPASPARFNLSQVRGEVFFWRSASLLASSEHIKKRP